MLSRRIKIDMPRDGGRDIPSVIAVPVRTDSPVLFGKAAASADPDVLTTDTCTYSRLPRLSMRASSNRRSVANAPGNAQPCNGQAVERADLLLQEHQEVHRLEDPVSLLVGIGGAARPPQLRSR